jgi:hypothetical protein
MAAAAASVAGIALNAATGGAAPWFPSMDEHYIWWLAGGTATGAAAGLLVWWSQRWYERGLDALLPAQQRPEPWMVDRPAEVAQIVTALVRPRRGATTVGITAAIHGAGGFGKTTLARLARSDRRVLRRFGGRVYWATLGRDVRRGALVERVNDLIRQIDAAQAQPFTDLRQAADRLAAVLAGGPRRLVILDDVWFDDQLAALPVAVAPAAGQQDPRRLGAVQCRRRHRGSRTVAAAPARRCAAGRRADRLGAPSAGCQRRSVEPAPQRWASPAAR